MFGVSIKSGTIQMFATSNPFARLIGRLQKTDRRDWESCSYGPEDGHKLEWCLDDCGREGAVARKGRHLLLRNGLQSYDVECGPRLA